MKFSRAFLAVTYFVAGLGFMALILSGEVGPIGMIAILASLVGSRGAPRRYAPSENVWRVFTAGFLIYAVLQLASLGETPLKVARDLLLYLQVNRLFMRKQNRDYGQIYLLSFLQILLGCILTINPLFALILVAFLVATAWAMLLLQMKIGLDEQYELEQSSTLTPGTDGDEVRYASGAPLLSWSFLAGSGGVTLAMLALTIGLFLGTPRMEISLFHNRAANAIHVAGFSEEVRLGEVGQILSRRDRVMRVRVEARPGVLPPLPYWRGMALDVFDGQTWKLSFSRLEAVHTRPVSLSRTQLPRGTNVVQRYTLEPLDSRVLFALPDVLQIESPLPTVLKNFTASYQTSEKQGRLDYVVYSKAREPGADELRGAQAELPPRVAHFFLQLPVLSPDVANLARQISAGQNTIYDRVRAIETHLRTRYTYTMDPQSSGQAPLEDFLFRTRSGHCEYFASAMVVLARSLGIPARMVNGFLGGEYNAIGGYYVVRTQDAHSWVEVWFSGFGWVRFDPTPPGAVAAASEDGSVGAMLRQYADFLEMQWYHYVLDYDLRAQLDLFSDLLTGVPSGGGAAFEESEAPGRQRLLVRRLIDMLALIGAVSGALWLYRRLRSAPDEVPALTTPTARRFLKQRQALHRELERRGFVRRPGETPRERATRAGRMLGVEAALREVEDVYYGARYGRLHVLGEQVLRVEAVVRQVKRLPVAPVKPGAPSPASTQPSSTSPPTPPVSTAPPPPTPPSV